MKCYGKAQKFEAEKLGGVNKLACQSQLKNKVFLNSAKENGKS
jgi:hypothetical protein